MNRVCRNTMNFVVAVVVPRVYTVVWWNRWGEKKWLIFFCMNVVYYLDSITTSKKSAQDVWFQTDRLARVYEPFWCVCCMNGLLSLHSIYSTRIFTLTLLLIHVTARYISARFVDFVCVFSRFFNCSHFNVNGVSMNATHKYTKNSNASVYIHTFLAYMYRSFFSLLPFVWLCV